MPRSIVDIGILDEEVQKQFAKHGGARDFHVVLWRQEPDITGSNWNARVERIRGETEIQPEWWGIVPQLRERFNLD